MKKSGGQQGLQLGIASEPSCARRVVGRVIGWNDGSLEAHPGPSGARHLLQCGYWSSSGGGGFVRQDAWERRSRVLPRRRDGWPFRLVARDVGPDGIRGSPTE